MFKSFFLVIILLNSFFVFAASNKKSALPQVYSDVYSINTYDGINVSLVNRNPVKTSLDQGHVGFGSLRIDFTEPDNRIYNQTVYFNPLPTDAATLWEDNNLKYVSFWIKSTRRVELNLSFLLMFRESATKVLSAEEIKKGMSIYSTQFTASGNAWQRIVIPLKKFKNVKSQFSLLAAKHSRIRIDISRKIGKNKDNISPVTVWIDNLEVVPEKDLQFSLFPYSDRQFNLFMGVEQVVIRFEAISHEGIYPEQADFYVTPYGDHSRIIFKKSIPVGEFKTKKAIYIKIPLNIISHYGPYEAFIDITFNKKVIRRKLIFGRAPVAVSDTSDYIGVQDCGNSKIPKALVGKGLVRQLVKWGHIEKFKGVFRKQRLEILDSNIDYYHSIGGKNLLCIAASSAAWAIRDPQKRAQCVRQNILAKSHGDTPHMSKTKDFADFLKFLLNRYKGKIYAIEIGNEVNMPHFFSGTPEDWIELLKVAHKVIKDFDPNIKIAGPALTGAFLPYLKKIMNLGAYKYLDAVSFHNYTTMTGPCKFGLARRITDAIKLSQKYKKNLKFWDTEYAFHIPPRFMGLPASKARIAKLKKEEPIRDNMLFKKNSRLAFIRSCSNEVCVEWVRNALTEKEAADAFVRQNIIGISAGLEYAVYFLSTSKWGYITHNNDLCLMGYAKIALRNILSSCTSGRRLNLKKSSVYVYKFKKGDKFLYAIWSMEEDKDTLLAFCKEPFITQTDIYGNEVEIKVDKDMVSLPCSQNTYFYTTDKKLKFINNPVKMICKTIISGNDAQTVKLTLNNPYTERFNASLILKVNKEIYKEQVFQFGKGGKKTLTFHIDTTNYPANKLIPVEGILKLEENVFSNKVFFQKVLVKTFKIQTIHPPYLKHIGSPPQALIDNKSQWVKGTVSKFQSWHENSSWRGIKDLSAKIWMDADSENIYFTVKVTDDQRCAKSGRRSFLNDSVELYLDLRNPRKWLEPKYSHGVYQFIIPTNKDIEAIGALPYVNDRQTETAYGAYKVSSTNDGYLLQVRIRMSRNLSKGFRLVAKQRFGIEIGINDRDDIDEKVTQHKLFKTIDSYKNPTSFGRYILHGKTIPFKNKKNLLFSEEDRRLWFKTKAGCKQENSLQRLGKFCLKMTQTDNDKKKLTFFLGNTTCKKGDVFLLSGWIKGDELKRKKNSLGKNRGAFIQANLINGKQVNLSAGLGTFDWTYLERIIEVKTNSTLLIVACKMFPDVTGTAYFDDICLEKLK